MVLIDEARENNTQYVPANITQVIAPKNISLKCLTTFGVLAFLLLSCTNVKQYQKAYLNDAEMKLSSRKIQKSEQNFQIYREGASGANGGKSGGGCGCN
jgi:Domain of unknown function (DUF4266)